MSSPAHRIAALGLLSLPLLAGCVGEETDQRPNLPAGIGSDDHRVSQGGIPEDMMPSQETAMDGVSDQGLPTYEDVAPDQPREEGGYADADPSALTDFHGTLDSHGQWIEDPSYGTMWQPSASEVGSDFAPYVSGGHWGMDDDNQYVWVSDYGWGWAPFHYGRWAYGGSGWGWIPGRTYAPSWVTWRTGYPGFGYVGWAPLPPTWYWGPGGVALGLGGVPVAPYVFCGTANLFAPYGLSSRIVTAPGAVQTIAGQTHVYAPSGGFSGGGNTPPARASNGSGGGGRVPANPSIVGPSPKSLNIPSSQVNRVGAANPQLARAAQMAHASTAMALGAHGPAVGGQLGATASQSGAARGGGSSGGWPGGAVAGHPQIASRATMPAYGGSSHSYYDNRSSTQLGSSYGHGGSMRTYGAPSGTHLGGGYHPTYQPYTGGSVPQAGTSSSHFGGHYGGSVHGSGGGHGGGHR
jgi:hypothetical protein